MHFVDSSFILPSKIENARILIRTKVQRWTVPSLELNLESPRAFLGACQPQSLSRASTQPPDLDQIELG